MTKATLNPNEPTLVLPACYRTESAPKAQSAFVASNFQALAEAIDALKANMGRQVLSDYDTHQLTKQVQLPGDSLARTTIQPLGFVLGFLAAQAQSLPASRARNPVPALPESFYIVHTDIRD